MQVHTDGGRHQIIQLRKVFLRFRSWLLPSVARAALLISLNFYYYRLVRFCLVPGVMYFHLENLLGFLVLSAVTERPHNNSNTVKIFFFLHGFKYITNLLQSSGKPTVILFDFGINTVAFVSYSFQPASSKEVTSTCRGLRRHMSCYALSPPGINNVPTFRLCPELTEGYEYWLIGESCKTTAAFQLIPSSCIADIDWGRSFRFPLM